MKWTIALLLFVVSLFAQDDSNPVLVVAQYRNPPYQIDTGTGYFTELVRATLDSLEINYSIVPKQSYVVAQKQYQLNQFDMLIGQMIQPTQEKEKLYSAENLLTVNQYIFGSDSLKASSIEGLRGKSIAIIQGAPYDNEFLAKVGMNLSVTIVETINDAAALLKSNDIHGIVADSASMLYNFPDAPLVTLLNEPVSEFTYTVTFLERTIEQELVDAFAETLKYVKESDVGKELREKWKIH